jgi:hypothetical protein
MVVFATGTASSTVDCLQAVAAFAKRSPETHRQHAAHRRRRDALRARPLRARRVGFASIAAAYTGMEMLGQAAGVPS